MSKQRNITPDELVNMTRTAEDETVLSWKHLKDQLDDDTECSQFPWTVV